MCYKIVKSKRGFLYAQSLESNDYWELVLRNAPKGLDKNHYAKYENRTMFYPFTEEDMDTIFQDWRNFPEIVKKRAFMFGKIMVLEPELE